MKPLLFCMCIVTCFTEVYAQKQSKFSFAVETNWGRSSVLPDQPDLTIEGHELSFDIGLLGSYAINKHLVISSGLKYSKWSFNIRNRAIMAPTVVATTGHSDYLEIPIRLLYYINPTKKNFFVLLGCTSSFLQGGQSGQLVRFRDGSEQILSTESIFIDLLTNSLLEFGFGYEKQIGPKWSAYLMPSCRVQLSNISTIAPLDRRQFFYGMAGGIKKQF